MEEWEIFNKLINMIEGILFVFIIDYIFKNDE